MLGSKDGMVNPGFWLDEEEDDLADPGAIRVLVCGNTGVGKSTLINKTFGVDVVRSWKHPVTTHATTDQQTDTKLQQDQRHP